MSDFDVCVVGSGAGGGPIAWTLARAGYTVVVLEKGPWLKEADFYKDEISACRRRTYVPTHEAEPQIVETDFDGDGDWSEHRTSNTGWDLWNGNLVGGASNLMSGFFQRMAPFDFHLRSEFGAVDGADVVDWPIGYDDLEPWYDMVERVVGVSGRAVAHPNAGPRSSPDFPLPPTAEHPVAGWIDETCSEMGLHPFPLPRAVLSQPYQGRSSCSYSGYCALYGCATGAKGSSRAALLDPAVATGRCEIRPNAMVTRLASDATGRVTHAEYIDKDGQQQQLRARKFVVACQAVQTARLLLMSTGPKHPDGLANRSGMVGRYLLFSAAGSAAGALRYDDQSEARAAELANPAPFINRSIQDWYSYKDESGQRRKGGTLDVIFEHPNPISNARWEMFDGRDNPLVWGRPLKRRMEKYFGEAKHLELEVFADWMPVPDSHVTLDPRLKDQWGLPVARVRIGKHPRNKEVATHLSRQGRYVLQRLGARGIRSSGSGGPSTNLQAGGCRFGRDPATSVLNASCRAHDVDNLYVSDGSFMPTGGSVPYTWTIYANAFRVAQGIVDDLGGTRG